MTQSVPLNPFLPESLFINDKNTITNDTENNKSSKKLIDDANTDLASSFTSRNISMELTENKVLPNFTQSPSPNLNVIHLESLNPNTTDISRLNLNYEQKGNFTVLPFGFATHNLKMENKEIDSQLSRTVTTPSSTQEFINSVQAKPTPMMIRTGNSLMSPTADESPDISANLPISSITSLTSVSTESSNPLSTENRTPTNFVQIDLSTVLPSQNISHQRTENNILRNLQPNIMTPAELLSQQQTATIPIPLSPNFVQTKYSSVLPLPLTTPSLLTQNREINNIEQILLSSHLQNHRHYQTETLEPKSTSNLTSPNIIQTEMLNETSKLEKMPSSDFINKPNISNDLFQSPDNILFGNLTTSLSNSTLLPISLLTPHSPSKSTDRMQNLNFLQNVNVSMMPPDISYTTKLSQNSFQTELLQQFTESITSRTMNHAENVLVLPASLPPHNYDSVTNLLPLFNQNL